MSDEINDKPPIERTGGARKSRMIVNLEPRIPELGRVAIGKKSLTNKTQGGHRLPEKLSYFLITGRERDSAGDFKVDMPLMEALAALQEQRTGVPIQKDDRGVPKLTEIPIVLLSDELEHSMRSEYAYYEGRKRMADCDGQTATWYFDKNGVKFPKPYIGPCRGEHLKEDAKGKTLFKVHATFGFAINSGGDAQRFGGVHKFRTTSIISLEQTVGSLRMIQGMTRGFLANIPLVLVVKPMEVSPDGKATTVYVVHVELRARDVLDVQKTVLQLAQANAVNVKELGAVRRDLERIINRPETEEEEEEVATEFHPERSDGPATPAAIVAPAETAATTTATPAAAAATPPASSAPPIVVPPKPAAPASTPAPTSPATPAAAAAPVVPPVATPPKPSIAQAFGNTAPPAAAQAATTPAATTPEGAPANDASQDAEGSPEDDLPF